MQTVKTVRCVFGSRAQEAMERLDQDWCAHNCGQAAGYDGDCYWHFIRLGMDPEDASTFQKNENMKSI